jgi:hypothetical protein
MKIMLGCPAVAAPRTSSGGIAADTMTAVPSKNWRRVISLRIAIRSLRPNAVLSIINFSETRLMQNLLQWRFH